MGADRELFFNDYSVLILQDEKSSQDGGGWQCLYNIVNVHCATELDT